MQIINENKPRQIQWQSLVSIYFILQHTYILLEYLKGYDSFPYFSLYMIHLLRGHIKYV